MIELIKKWLDEKADVEDEIPYHNVKFKYDNLKRRELKKLMDFLKQKTVSEKGFLYCDDGGYTHHLIYTGVYTLSDDSYTFYFRKLTGEQ